MFIDIITCKCVCAHVQNSYSGTPLKDLKSTCSVVNMACGTAGRKSQHQLPNLSTSPPGTAFQGWTKFQYTRERLTWNHKMIVFKRSFLFQGLIFRFHVKLQGVYTNWALWIWALGQIGRTKTGAHRPGFGPENVGTDTHLIKGIKET